VATPDIIVDAGIPPNRNKDVGPDVDGLIACCFRGKSATFKLKTSLDASFGPFSGVDSFSVMNMGVQRAGNAPLDNRWHIYFESGLPPDSPDQVSTDYRNIHIVGIYDTTTISALFHADHLWLNTLEEMVDLPGFRWRKDLDHLLHVNNIVIHERSIVFRRFDSEYGVAGDESVDPGEYPSARLVMINNSEPWILVDSKLHPGQYAGIHLTNAILEDEPKIDIHWKHDADKRKATQKKKVQWLTDKHYNDLSDKEIRAELENFLRNCDSAKEFEQNCRLRFDGDLKVHQWTTTFRCASIIITNRTERVEASVSL